MKNVYKKMDFRADYSIKFKLFLLNWQIVKINFFIQNYYGRRQYYSYQH
jgi:hypothetical protein